MKTKHFLKSMLSSTIVVILSPLLTLVSILLYFLILPIATLYQVLNPVTSKMNDRLMEMLRI